MIRFLDGYFILFTYLFFGWLLLLCVCVYLHVMICFCMSLCVSTAGLDIGPLTNSSPMAPPSQAGRRTPRSLPEEPLDGILSPELDKMVTDGQCGRQDIQTFSVFLHCYFKTSYSLNDDLFSLILSFQNQFSANFTKFQVCNLILPCKTVSFDPSLSDTD